MIGIANRGNAHDRYDFRNPPHAGPSRRIPPPPPSRPEDSYLDPLPLVPIRMPGRPPGDGPGRGDPLHLGGGPPTVLRAPLPRLPGYRGGIPPGRRRSVPGPEGTPEQGSRGDT